MERFEHLSMVAFLILGLAMVRLMINLTSLMAKNTIHNKKEEVKFYWPHSVFCFITFFTSILFWWTCYPLNNLDYFPDKGWNLFTYLLFLSVPFLFFMICEVIAPQELAVRQSLDLREHYYRYHRVILGLAWTLQVCLIGNLFVFFHGELYSLKVLGRLIMLTVMAPMVLSNNKRLHEIGMGIFFIGFIYTIVKYHIYI